MVEKLSSKKDNASYWDKWEGQGIEVPVDNNQKSNGSYWDKWEGQGVEVPVEAPEDSWGGSLQSLGRGVISGVADTLTLPANALIGLHNARLEQNATMDPETLALADPEAIYIPPERVEEAKLPSIPSASQALVGGESNTPLQQGLEFGASVLTPAGVAGGLAKVGGKAAASASKLFGAIGSSKPLVVGGAAAGGATSQYLQDEGFGGGSQFAGGLGADLGFQALNPRNLVKGTAKVLGLGKKQFKTDVADAFDRIGVDQFGPALSDSKLLAHGTQQINKLPFAGDFLRNKYKKSSEQFQKSFEKRIADEVGPQLTNEIKAESRNFYAQADQLLPENAMIVPKNTANQMSNLFKENSTLIKSEKTNKLFEILEQASEALQGGNIPVPIDILVNTKKNLNQMVKWDSDKKGSLALLQRAVTEDIAEYGKLNKQWYAEFQKADQNFAQIAKRQTLDNLISGKIEDSISGEVRYIPFVKQLLDPKYKNKIENILGKDNTQKLEDFITAAKGMAQAERNIPNPSGTAATQQANGAIKGILAAFLGYSSLPAAGATASSIAVTTYLISNKRFLNKAKDFAKKPSEPLAKQLEAIVKDNTGYTLHELNRLYEDQEKKE